MSVGAPSVAFLDRDGTIIEDTHFIRSPDDVRLIPGAGEAIAALNAKGIPVVVVTNQSGIARGLLTVEDYQAVRARVDDLLAAKGARIDRTYYCPHHPDVTGPCECRKPGTRLFRDALREMELPAGEAVYIGDRMRDVSPSRELGGRGILIASPMTGAGDAASAAEAGIEKAADLQGAVKLVLSLTEAADSK